MPSRRSKTNPTKDQSEKERGTPKGSKPEETPRSDAFDTWAIIEVMGHNTFAGRVSEQSIGGASFIRVDVPELPADKYYPAQPAFTKFIGAGSIYAMTPCIEEIARQAAARLRVRPISMVSLETNRALPAAECSDRYDREEEEDNVPY